ncbi:RNA-binding [Hirschfeldia incana]|nr:RNA-binding [Hirschfeldia incana]KAJ0237481.1 RNA-binding [Hirschfeldia incana]
MAYHSIPRSGFHHMYSPFGDTTYTKVFVGGLAWETQSETLRRHFEPYGEILEAVVIYDKNTGRSKGYGFVTFRDLEDARRACADPTPIVDGRRANCNLASLGRPRLIPMQYALLPNNIPGRIRPASPYAGSVHSPRVHPYQQPPAYSYQQGMMYPYGVSPYGPEYMYSQSQGLYGPYTGQQHLQVYGVRGADNSTGHQYGHLSQNIPVGQGYTTVQRYSAPESYIQSPYPSAMAGPAPTQSHIIVQTPQYTL